MKKILITIITWYQKIPLSTHKQCRYYPTCSEYAKEALETHGVIKGVYLSTKRILRCNPFSSYGYDPVPPRRKKT